MTGQGMLAGMLGRSVVCVAFGASLLACTGGTETGNPPFQGSLSYTGYSSKPETIGVREGGSIATVKSAWLDLREVRFSAEGGCALPADGAFSVPALGIGDHAAGAHVTTAYSAEPGSYCSVELPFGRVPRDTTQAALPDELAGHSILLEGELADGTPFSLRSAREPVVSLRAESGGFSLAAANADALFAFDFATWLGAIDFTSVDVEAGRIVISDAENAEALAAFEAALADGVTLYRDRDADGRLDDELETLAR
jgi:hypothetical protein